MTELLQRLQTAVADQYTVQRELGGGGMSRVFLAEETALGRKVVIKVLPPEMAAGVNVERFHKEIQLAAKLQHPHIVPVLSAGATGDLIYYVMPYIDGESLRARLTREGELPIAETLRILKEVVDALSYAHLSGLVHRDIKPDNVLLSSNHAVVTDFGVAKAVSASSGETSLTSLGVALGTPAYMAPEQAAADPHVDHRADLYSVGALAYEMLCGRPPFTGTNPQALLAAHITQVPQPVTMHRTSVSPELSAVVMRCLEKKAADRWQNAGELLQTLDAMVTPSGGMTPTGTQPVAAATLESPGRTPNQTRVIALFGVAAAAVTGLAYVLMIALGLPDWVFPAAIVLLAIGLPIIHRTARVERHRVRASTTGLSHPSLDIGLNRWFTWRKAILGGFGAFAFLGLVTGGYMLMRALGIGPAGTLVASGVLNEKDRIILADFNNRTPDSTLGVSVTEAIRIDLAQSPVIRLVERSDLPTVLERMGRPDSPVLDDELAFEIAKREGIKAVVRGEIGPVGSGFVLSATVSSADGRVLTAVRETAGGTEDIIAAIDKLSAKLRERIGESLRTIRAAEPLEQVSTSSLEALEKYSRSLSVYNRGEVERAIRIMEEAVEADSTFAMAYRKLAVFHSNNSDPISEINDAALKAYRFRDRLPRIERYLTEAYYFSSVRYDTDRMKTAYRSVLDLDPGESTSLNNLALQYNLEGNFQAAAELAGRALEGGSEWVFFNNAIWAAVGLGDSGKVHQLVDSAEKALGTANPNYLQMKSWVHASERRYDSAGILADSILHSQRDSKTWRRAALGLKDVMLVPRGRIREAVAAVSRLKELSMEEERAPDYIGAVVRLALLRVTYDGDSSGAHRLLAEAMAEFPLEETLPADRQYFALAAGYAAAGDVRRARELVAGGEANLSTDIIRSSAFRWDLMAQGLMAFNDGDYSQAIDAFRELRTSTGCKTCFMHEEAQAYERMNQPDSALRAYERAVQTTDLFRFFGENLTLAATYKRLGELYEGRGDTDKAIDYYSRFADLWQEADPELQPVVKEVRARIARLVGERR